MRQALILFLVTLFAGPSYPQAVTLSDEARLKLPSVGGVRYTNPFPANIAPLWGTGTVCAGAIGTQTLTRNIAYSLDLRTLCCNPDQEAKPSQSLTVTEVSGTTPTGLSFSDNALTGTPTTVQNVSKTYACSDGVSSTNQAITFDVVTPDATAPDAPSGCFLSERLANSATITCPPSADPSGIAEYRLYRTVNSGDVDSTLKASSASPILTDTTITTSMTRYYKVEVEDGEGNTSSRGNEVQVGPFAASAPLLAEFGFEGGTLAGLTISGVTPTVSTTSAREGTRSMRCEISRQSPLSANTTNTIRCEANPGIPPVVGEGRWFGSSICLPSSGFGVSENEEIITQYLHSSAGGNPAIALRIGNSVLSVNTSTASGIQSFPIGTATLDQWQDFVAYLVPSTTSGVLKVWWNGALKIDYTGPTMRADQASATFKFHKFGEYHWPYQFALGASSPASRILYQDAIRIGGPNNVYADVAPQGNRVSATCQ